MFYEDTMEKVRWVVDKVLQERFKGVEKGKWDFETEKHVWAVEDYLICCPYYPVQRLILLIFRSKYNTCLFHPCPPCAPQDQRQSSFFQYR